MWRISCPEEDDQIVEMSLALNREDPGPKPVPEENPRLTLAKLRENPVRGQVIVLDIEGRLNGYSFLVSFWSNELGGEICTIDEFYVRPYFRGKGYGENLIQILTKKSALWPRDAVAIDLEVTPDNARARNFYQRMGFKVARNTHMRMRF